ncbi:signal peptidase I [Streptomyces fuscigenes]|uniref:signal peptidase I n=1 Tax=Streptomyces fuscigenes TaxID=1528880 RepID=UPI001F34C6E0|nr:signal peptidase I [Streptomyces fuscigenes]MCF3962490.1 signal peptidase I [Streptomyces fuscigenes]
MSRAARTNDGRGRLGSRVSGLVVALGCVLFLGGFAWAAVEYQPWTVPTGSMTPTIKAGDKVLAQRISGDEVHRGDVVVFKDSEWGDLPLVKRVVGIGGDTVACCDKQGRMSVDGRPLDEPYTDKTIGGGRAANADFSAKVPAGELFMLGDERATSLDSRVHLQDSEQGSVPRTDVRGRVDAVAWPPASLMARPGTFAALPGGTSSPGPLRLMAVAVIAGAVLIFLGAALGPLLSRGGRGRPAPAGSRETAGAR